MLQEHTDRFLNVPAELGDPVSARYVVLPIPYEGTVSYEPGTARGPLAIIEASAHVECYDPELNGEFISAGIATCPVIQPAPGPEEQIRRVREAAEKILRSGKFLLSLGGEHSITIGLVAATAAVHGDISILQIDAHSDLRDTFGGSKYSHACVMRRILEITDSICQVGIRSYSADERDQCPAQVEKFITPDDVAADERWMGRAMGMLGEKVYITLDIDGLDPSIAPGTGTPEPGGLSWKDVTGLLRRVCSERNVVAADIVEVRPISPNHVTEFIAAKLGYKMIAYTQL